MVIRSREIPSGTDGGRKQPTRTRSSRAAAWAATATCGDGIGTESTAPLGVVDAERAGRAAATRSVITPGSVGCSRSTSSAASAPGRRGGREAGVEDERPGPVDQVLDDGGGAEHRAALGAERLGQGRGHHDVVLAGQAEVGDQAAPAGAGHAQAVRLVDHQQRVVRRADPGQLEQRRGVAEHGVDRLRQHHRPPAAGAGERGRDAATSLCGTTATSARASRAASTSEAWTWASETIRQSRSASAVTAARLAW